MTMQTNLDNESLEIRLLLEAIYLKYGYDFRGYAQSTLRNSLQRQKAAAGLPSISAMQHLMLNDLVFFESMLMDFTVNVTTMFRDPSFFTSVRSDILPGLRERTPLKVWSAGCSTGEEVYSLAIMLHEAGIYDRARIYATDIDQVALHKASLGVYPIDRMQEYSHNYRGAGGEHSFVDYFCADDHLVMMSEMLKRNIVFSDHNLVSDAVFGEMDLIVCRNVLIYFDQELQTRVLQLLRSSLRPGGFLCLGSSESVKLRDFDPYFEEVSGVERIYKRVECKRAELRLVDCQRA